MLERERGKKNLERETNDLSLEILHLWANLLLYLKARWASKPASTKTILTVRHKIGEIQRLEFKPLDTRQIQIKRLERNM